MTCQFKSISLTKSRTKTHKIDSSTIGRNLNCYLSFTLEHGSINSSFAATRATEPSAILFRYTKGVFPINYTNYKYKYKYKNK